MFSAFPESHTFPIKMEQLTFVCISGSGSQADGQSLCWCLFESMRMVHLVPVPFCVCVPWLGVFTSVLG